MIKIMIKREFSPLSIAPFSPGRAYFWRQTASKKDTPAPNPHTACVNFLASSKLRYPYRGSRASCLR